MGFFKKAADYLEILYAMQESKSGLDMPGEMLKSKLKPPKKMFRRRVCHV